MPYSGVNDPNLPPNVKNMPIGRRRQWIAIVNQCIADGGKDGDCMHKANGVLAEMADFTNVELFRAGTWTDSKGRTRKWTVRDLQEIATAYSETKDDVHAPIKLGHDDSQKLVDGEPAMGWLENIRRTGDRLIGDFIGVPDKLAKLISEGAYRARSVELQPDFKVGEKTYKWLVTGVALLGAKLPAVSGLKDIVNLYESAHLDYNADYELVLYQESEDDDFDAELESIFERLNTALKNKRGAPQIRALQLALKNAINSSKGRSNNEMDKEKLSKLLGISKDASDEDFEKAITDLQGKSEHSKFSKLLGLSEDASEADFEKAITDLKGKAEHADSNSDAEKRLIELEKKQAVQEATAVVDEAIKAGKLLPKQKEMALKMAQRDLVEFQEFIKTQPENLVEFGERGSSKGDNINMAALEPTPDEIVVAKQMNVYSPEWRVNLMKQKARAANIELPADFGKTS